MNVITRGIRNALRNTVRTVSIVLILGLSTGLVLTMLAARQAVSDKIAAVKSASGTTITISPAGVRGFEGGGTPLSAAQLAKIPSIPHVTKVVDTLNDRIPGDQTTLQSAIQPGEFGRRQSASANAEFGGNQGLSNGSPFGNAGASASFTLPIMVTGTSDSSAIGTGSTVTWKSGSAFSGSSNDNVAVIGSGIAQKNNLSVGSTFTAYNTSIKVVGIYDTGTIFGNNGVYLPLASLQRLSGQPGAITGATAYVDSSDNLANATTSIKNDLGSAADITNSQDIANATAQPLESVKTITLWSMIGAIAAGAIIILLTMMMIVRERRREIGVMKAIGASNGKITLQFIVESITLTVLGLVVGVLIGIAAATPITNALVTSSSTSSSQTRVGRFGFGGPRAFGATSRRTLKQVTASVGTTTLFEGFGAAVLIAVIGSAVPSYIISNIKPAEAMRNE